jgi:hypothetical protein
VGCENSVRLQVRCFRTSRLRCSYRERRDSRTTVVALAAAFGVLARSSGSTDEIAYLGNGKVYLVQADGTNRRAFVSGGSAYQVDDWGDLSWTRDGERLAFTIGDHNLGPETLQISVAAADGRQVRPLTAKGHSILRGHRRQPARVRRVGLQSGIAVIDADGHGLRLIIKSTGGNNWVRMVTRRRLDLRLWRSRTSEPNPWPSADGTGLHQLAVFNTGGQCVCRWSPGGRASPRGDGQEADDSRPEIVMNADGSGRTRLRRTMPGREPRWSPDGDHIASTANGGGRRDLRHRADGGRHGGSPDLVQRRAWASVLIRRDSSILVP